MKFPTSYQIAAFAISLSFWAFWPHMPFAFTLPKLLVVTLGLTTAVLLTERSLRVNIIALIGLLLLSVTAIFGNNIHYSIIGFSSEWTQSLWALGVLVALTAFPSTGQPVWLKWSGVLLAVHAVLQRFGCDPLLAQSILPQGRAVAYVGSPVDLGAILAMAAPLAGPWLPVIALGIWATGSRAAMLAAVTAVLPWKLRWAPWLLAALLFVSGYVFSFKKDKARIETWKIAWSAIKERPILGHGPNTFVLDFLRLKTSEFRAAIGNENYQSHPHNIVLEAWHAGGYLGIVVLALLAWPLLQSPSLIALLIVLMFDPVGFEELAAGALLAANHGWKAQARSTVAFIAIIGLAMTIKLIQAKGVF